MVKYKRNYLLNIEKKDGTTLSIRPPFTVEFDIHRNSFSSASASSVRIYNLNPDNRNQIRVDQFDSNDKKRVIEFYAGYGDKLSLAFKGNISQAFSVREGVNFISQIECFDGGFAYLNAVTDAQFPGETPKTSIIDALIADMPGVSRGAIGSYPGSISRGNAYSGSSTELLREFTQGGFFIDNSTANCLNDSECLEGDVIVISAESGLLGTPLKEQQYINLEMLFEPSLKIGQLVDLQSQTAAEAFNGTHKVIWLKHRGMVSDAVCGDAVTSVGLLQGSFFPVKVGG